MQSQEHLSKCVTVEWHGSGRQCSFKTFKALMSLDGHSMKEISHTNQHCYFLHTNSFKLVAFENECSRTLRRPLNHRFRESAHTRV